MRELDERVLSIRQSITSKGFAIAYYALLGMITIRFFYLRQSMNEMADIVTLFGVLTTFNIYQHIKLGVYHKENQTRHKASYNVFREIIYLIVVTIGFSFITGETAPAKLAVFTVLMICMRIGIHTFTKMSKNVVEKELEE